MVHEASPWNQDEYDWLKMTVKLDEHLDFEVITVYMYVRINRKCIFTCVYILYVFNLIQHVLVRN